MAHLESESSKSAADFRLYALAAVVAYTGFSQGDACRLKVADLDFEGETIRVEHRDFRRHVTPGLVPMTPELAGVLKAWLERRRQPLNSQYKMDEVKAVECRRLRSEGWKILALAGRYGVSRKTIHSVLAGRSWGHLPDEGEVSRRVADSEWLFPQIVSGSTAPWTQVSREFKSSTSKTAHSRLKKAGEAAGIEDFELRDLRYIHRYYVVPAVVSLNPGKAKPLAELSPVLLGGPNTPPVVLGRAMAVLTPAEFNVVQALLNVYPKGLSWPELDARSGQAFTRTVVKRLKEKDPAWDSVIMNPKDHPDGVCGIVAH